MFLRQISSQNFISEIFYPCTRLCLHPTKECNSIHLPYFTLPPLPPFVSYFSFLFRDEGLSYHAFAAVAVCQFSFLLGILHIFPISFCCCGVLLYFSYINLLLQSSPIFLLYHFSVMRFSYVLYLHLVNHRPVSPTCPIAHPAPTASAPLFIILGTMAQRMLSGVTICNFAKHSIYNSIL